MLMEPLIGRYDDTAGFPVDALHRLSFRPKNRVALTGKYNHVSAGTMFVALLVSANRKLRDMCTHGLLGKIELHIRAALAALTVIRKADRLCVRDEISRHEKATRNFAFAAEVTFGGRVEAVEERIVIVKNKINVVEQVHHETAIRHGEITRRLAATRIEMLVVRVDGNSEQTSWSPFEGLLLAILLPYRSGAIAFGHVNHLFIEMFLRFGLAPRRNLANITVIHAAATVENHERAGHALQIPWNQLDLIDIFDEKTFDYWNLLRCLPVPISIDPFRLKIARLSSLRHDGPPLSTNGATGMIHAHVASRSCGFHRCLKIFVDLRIFVLELDLTATQFDARKAAAFAVLRTHETKAPVIPAEGQIARRFCAGVEMLVEPSIGGNNDASRLPINPLHLRACRPQYRVALAGQDNNVRAGTVPVAFLIGPHGKF